MYSVIAPIPEELATAVQRYRQKYDPLVNVIPPHITVLAPFPYTDSPQSLQDHLTEVGETHAPIKVSVVGWDIHKQQNSYQLRLPVIAGKPQFSTLRNHLLSGPLNYPAQKNKPYWAHISFGQLHNDIEAEQARKTLKDFEAQFIFRVTTLNLFHKTDNRSPWILQKKFGLEATIISSRRRSKTPSLLRMDKISKR